MARFTFVSGHLRILDRIKPKPLWFGGAGFYWMARWRRNHGPTNHRANRIWYKPKPGQRGWMPGRWRIDGMKAPLRVINPAIRYEPINRACAEVFKVRRKQRAYHLPYLWDKPKPKRAT